MSTPFNKIKKVLIKSVLFLFILLYGCVATSTDCFKHYNSINLISFDNMLFTTIKLNGKDALFLIDTGASKSLLDINKAEEYKFKYILFSRTSYIGIGGNQDVYSAYDYKMDKFYVYVLATDLSEITPYFSKNNLHIVGIIGSDFFSSHRAFIDYDNLKIYYLN